MASEQQQQAHNWVAFEQPAPFQPGTTARKKKSQLGTSNRPARASRSSSVPTITTSNNWRETPIQTDAALQPLPPPIVGRRLPSRNKPTSPRHSLQPVNPAPGRAIRKKQGTENKRDAVTESSTSTLETEQSSAPKSEALTSRSQTCSTSSSSESEEPKTATRPPTTLAPLPPPGSNRQRGRPTNQAANGRPPSRGRSTSAGRTTPRGRSTSRTRAPTQPTRRSRSNSVSSRGGHSQSSNRPPATRHNVRHRSRSRSRSASLTRVTGPSTPRSTRPPTTGRLSRDVRLHPSGSNSIGPGVTPRSTVSDDVSASAMSDDNIGRDISFGLSVTSKPSSSKGSRGDSKSHKKGGFMEKLFGSQGDKRVPAVLRGGVQYEIRPRILLAATVYHNTATNLWITTINTNQRGVARDPTTANRYLKAFSFSTEREARESAIANAPPKMVPFKESPECFVCKSSFAVFRRASHCRNCGVCVCSQCSTTWPAKMIPETYNLKKEANVKICLSCNSLSSSFKKALSEGDYEEAVALYGTGNVNLRTPFPVANKKDEAMYPIHCAVEGGNIDVIRWLIDDHFCPIKLVRSSTSKKSRGASDYPILTSKGRSILSIAIDSVKVDIMRYLVIECGVSIYESTDLKSSLRALEAALIALPSTAIDRASANMELPVSTRWDKASFDEISEPSSLGIDEPLIDDFRSIGSRRSSRTRGEACIICFDRKIDCCSTPCGHQMCCLECSTNLSACPVCNTRGEFIKIFRP